MLFAYYFLYDIMKKDKKIFCFDFDGTIADTLPLIIKVLDRLLKKQGEQEISDNVLRQIREEGIEEALKNIGTPLYKLFFIYLKIKKEMNRGVLKIQVRDEIRDMIKKIKNDGHEIGILTLNSKENVNNFLENNNLDIFDFIVVAGIFGKQKIIKKLKRKGGTFIYIGDETRDISAGRKAGVKTVGVTWGLGSKKALLRSKPDILIENPKELINIPF